MKQLYDIVIIGAGPAGLAAANAAQSSGASICIVDDNPATGGQIWRGGAGEQKDARARKLQQALQAASNVTTLQGAKVLYQPAPGELLVQTGEDAHVLRYQNLVLATGARELLLPFPGWTLPGVTGAGGLQALAKGGYPVEGKRVVVAGSGPLLLAVAATLLDRGAQVAAIIEQAGTPALARFAAGLLATPSKVTQGLQLLSRLRAVPYMRNSYVVAARGDGALRQVEINRNGQSEVIDADYLACGYGLLPNTELASALGCAIEQGAVRVDGYQQTSVPFVYCAGEGTGVGGVDKALVEGHIAGLAASGQAEQTSHYWARRARWQGFAARLAQAFTLRHELRQLPAADTIVCRCEDVTHAELRPHATWRSAKLHTRCGMGPCQGRICGVATNELYGWRPDAVRIPISPARAGSLIAIEQPQTP